MSIQSFNSSRLYENTTSDFYDFIIVDEFHHAEAPSYKKLLDYYAPKILLGLTATPERMDGKNVLERFDEKMQLVKDRLEYSKYKKFNINILP